MKVTNMAKLMAAVLALGVASAASAQSAGQWTVKAGMNRITPKVKSGQVSAPALPDSRADVKEDTQPVLIFAYGLTDNISTEVALGTPYNHDVVGAGAIEGTGKLAEVQALPPTVFLQYRFFEPSARIRPYVGAGLTYAWFRRTEGSGKLTALTNTGGEATTIKLDSKFAGTLQVGVAVAIDERWFADVGFTKTFLKTRAFYSTGQTQDMQLDPQGVSLTVGYKF